MYFIHVESKEQNKQQTKQKQTHRHIKQTDGCQVGGEPRGLGENVKRLSLAW